MARTKTLTSGSDSFRQNAETNNGFMTVNGLGGNDTILMDRDDDLGGRVTVDAGSGNDTVITEKEDGNTIRLGTGNDTYFGRGFGSLTGEISDQLFAGDGNDKIIVGTFHSVYRGESGNDTFISVGWANTFSGGSGTDTISYEARDEDFTLGGTAVTIDLAAGLVQTGPIKQETLFSIENATGSNQNDLIGGNSVRNVLIGRGGDDDLQGFGGNDRIYGGAGGDLLTGGSGADAFVYKTASEAPKTIPSGGFREEIADFSHAQGDKLDFKSMDADITQSGIQHFHFVSNGQFTGAGKELIFVNGILAGDRNHDGTSDFRIFFDDSVSLVASDFLLS